jgi:hypothetical protein
VLKCPKDMKQICDEFVKMAKYTNNNEKMNGNNDDEHLVVVNKGITVCENKIRFCLLKINF